MASSWSLAVDFGTTNTAAAITVDGGAPQAVRLGADADQMPSAVLVRASGIATGRTAQTEAQSAPDGFEPTPKRRVGEAAVHLGGRDVTPAALVAAVLEAALDGARRAAGGRSPAAVVLTHPVDWAADRRDVLRAAAAAAGLPASLRFVAEPVAAAAYYAAGRRVAPGQRVAVFDFGGGTCDVAVLRVTERDDAPFVTEVARGRDQLGGDLLDLRLLRWALDTLRADGDDDLADHLESPEGRSWLLLLRDQVRQAKHTVAKEPGASVTVLAGDRRKVLWLGSDAFDRCVATDLDDATQLVRETLADARLRPQDLAAVYMTGGSSFVRGVQRRLGVLFGGSPQEFDDPKLVVARGALLVPAGSETRPSGDASPDLSDQPPVPDRRVRRPEVDWDALEYVLATYVRDHPSTALDRVSEVRRQLTLLAPDQALGTNVLVAVLEDGGVHELLRTEGPVDALAATITRRLVTERALAETHASSAVETWLRVLDRR